MKTHRAGLAVEKPDSTQRGSGLPVTITNTYLPAIEELPRKRRSRARDGLTPDDTANDPFDVSVLLKDLEDPTDADGRRWPALADRPRDRVPDLERIVDAQSKDLSKRCAQIADLSNANQQQAEALLIAREAIEGLDRSVTLLREELTQQDHEAANAKQELVHARNETHALW